MGRVGRGVREGGKGGRWGGGDKEEWNGEVQGGGGIVGVKSGCREEGDELEGRREEEGGKRRGRGERERREEGESERGRGGGGRKGAS